MMDATVSAGVASALLDLAAAKGADAAMLTRNAGIEPGALGDPDGRVPMASYVRLMRAAKTAVQDPALGLHFGEAYEMRDISVVGVAAAPAGNISGGLGPLNRFARLAVEAGHHGEERFRLVERGKEVWLEDRRSDPDAFHELTESTFARIVTTMRRSGAAGLLRKVHFTHSAPAYRDEYQRIFGVPLQFRSRWNALGFDREMLGRAVAAPPGYLHGVMTKHAETLLGKLDRDKSFAHRVEQELTMLLPAGGGSAEAVAAKLSMSRQTLFRRLKAEGSSFERLSRELKTRLAVEYLRNGRTPIAQAAHQLGFADRASFSKAFKRWTGRSPGEVGSGDIAQET
jgi:AraC-like DNA-binding protein